ncbi:SRPBCC family protein [Caulobacter sp.]|uniref:SRPBCC family protein n=1 Tax=Caulobacter sp. TaxID=78 RepID=UPI002B47C203|nr:SRPBCC family protein [Caulobacter sp.]HJV44066.1 SRPBCC family protein [Caulobacter sp.]
MGERVSDGRTTVERRSERELVVTRIFDGPVRLVFDAWTKPELFQLWWAPKSGGVPMLACEMDSRTGGGYSVTFGKDAENAMTFYGKYLEVTPPSRLVWTNDESEQGAITTVTFEEEEGDRTLLVLQELYPSKEALDESFVGMEDAMPEQFRQLDELLATQTARV